MAPREERGKIRCLFGINEPSPGESLNAVVVQASLTYADPHALVVYCVRDIEKGEEVLIYYGSHYERDYLISQNAEEEDDAGYDLIKEQHKHTYGDDGDGTSMEEDDEEDSMYQTTEGERESEEEEDEDESDSSGAEGFVTTEAECLREERKSKTRGRQTEGAKGEEDSKGSSMKASSRASKKPQKRGDGGSSASRGKKNRSENEDDGRGGGDDNEKKSSRRKRRAKQRIEESDEESEASLESSVKSHNTSQKGNSERRLKDSASMAALKTDAASGSGKSAVMAARLKWRTQDISYAKQQIDEIYTRHKGIKTMEAVFRIVYDAVTLIQKNQDEEDAIFLVLDRLWNKAMSEEGGTDGQGSPKDVLRRMFRCVMLDMKGEWLDGKARIREICGQLNGITYVLDTVAEEVLGRPWSTHLRREVEECKMNPEDSDMQHYSKFRKIIDNMPWAFRHEDAEVADYFIDSLPDEMSGQCRLMYKARMKENKALNMMGEPLTIAYECMQALWMRQAHVTRGGSLKAGGSKRRGGDVNSLDSYEMGDVCGFEGGGGGGPRKHCDWCDDKGRNSDHFTKRCYASGNHNSCIPMAWRYVFGGGKDCIITETLCREGSNQAELERAFEASGREKWMVRVFLEELKGTAVKEIKPCMNCQCHAKNNPGRIDLRKLKYEPHHCEANRQLIKGLLEIANKLVPDARHGEEVNSLQRDEQWALEKQE